MNNLPKSLIKKRSLPKKVMQNILTTVRRRDIQTKDPKVIVDVDNHDQVTVDDDRVEDQQSKDNDQFEEDLFVEDIENDNIEDQGGEKKDDVNDHEEVNGEIEDQGVEKKDDVNDQVEVDDQVKEKCVTLNASTKRPRKTPLLVKKESSKRLTKLELIELCKENGLPVDGTIATLKERLSMNQHE